MGCSGSEEKEPEKVEVQEEKPKETPQETPPEAPESSDDSEGDFDVNVGLRIMVGEGEEAKEHFFRLEFKIDPKKRVKHVTRMVNHVLKANPDVCGDKRIEGLVPTWTPDWSCFEEGKKLKKALKHSTDGEGNEFNMLKFAEEGHDINLVAYDADTFKPELWNDHYANMKGDEFTKVDCEDFSEDSS